MDDPHRGLYFERCGGVARASRVEQLGQLRDLRQRQVPAVPGGHGVDVPREDQEQPLVLVCHLARRDQTREAVPQRVPLRGGLSAVRGCVPSGYHGSSLLPVQGLGGRGLRGEGTAHPDLEPGSLRLSGCCGMPVHPLPRGQGLRERHHVQPAVRQTLRPAEQVQQRPRRHVQRRAAALAERVVRLGDQRLDADRHREEADDRRGGDAGPPRCQRMDHRLQGYVVLRRQHVDRRAVRVGVPRQQGPCDDRADQVRHAPHRALHPDLPDAVVRQRGLDARGGARVPAGLHRWDARVQAPGFAGDGRPAPAASAAACAGRRVARRRGVQRLRGARARGRDLRRPAIHDQRGGSCRLAWHLHHWELQIEWGESDFDTRFPGVRRFRGQVPRRVHEEALQRTLHGDRNGGQDVHAGHLPFRERD
mmetsp:Transcript_3926/g.9386  ORF Transcript_3926/g.9386 Transcript_3926/m.9386 type:complete len:420 (-) Transcript_3926:331-1590(-)